MLFDLGAPILLHKQKADVPHTYVDYLMVHTYSVMLKTQSLTKKLTNFVQLYTSWRSVWHIYRLSFSLGVNTPSPTPGIFFTGVGPGKVWHLGFSNSELLK